MPSHNQQYLEVLPEIVNKICEELRKGQIFGKTQSTLNIEQLIATIESALSITEKNSDSLKDDQKKITSRIWHLIREQKIADLIKEDVKNYPLLLTMGSAMQLDILGQAMKKEIQDIYHSEGTVEAAIEKIDHLIALQKTENLKRAARDGYNPSGNFWTYESMSLAICRPMNWSTNPMWNALLLISSYAIADVMYKRYNEYRPKLEGYTNNNDPMVAVSGALLVGLTSKFFEAGAAINRNHFQNDRSPNKSLILAGASILSRLIPAGIGSLYASKNAINYFGDDQSKDFINQIPSKYLDLMVVFSALATSLIGAAYAMELNKTTQYLSCNRSAENRKKLELLKGALAALDEKPENDSRIEEKLDPKNTGTENQEVTEGGINLVIQGSQTLTQYIHPKPEEPTLNTATTPNKEQGLESKNLDEAKQDQLVIEVDHSSSSSERSDKEDSTKKQPVPVISMSGRGRKRGEVAKLQPPSKKKGGR